MASMAHVYEVRFHKRDMDHVGFKWSISDSVKVTAMTPESAERLARRALELGPEWVLRKCDDWGAWNRQNEVKHV